MTTILDPTAERSVAARPRLARPESLEGLKIGLLDIAKTKGDVFLDRLEERLSERGHEVKRYAKPTNTRPAPTALSQQIATEVDVVIEALSD
ncbi:MAG: hypothetical protein CBC34_015865 [Hyphomicrobiaceae bacterium TMED74]|nr:hypothetical protein [Filomicrobium sp.]RPG38526.1 MAG: hypothetical protein CBC34_015865 [Hyphomicrobiaceae bacterium TMED74]